MDQRYDHIDSHKLKYHPIRLAEWYQGKDIYPLFVELSPINICNYRCQFCAFDYTGYKGSVLSEGTLLGLIKDLADIGVKSIVFAGTGEPLLHKGLAKVIETAYRAGLDIGLSTNGYFMTDAMADKILPFLTWIRFSFNAGTPESYGLIHGCKPEAFNTVVKNISSCVNIKQEKGLPVTLGMQSLILKDNQADALKMAVLGKQIGVDYLSFKPFSPHPLSLNENIGEQQLLLEEDALNELHKLSDAQYQIIVRKNAIKALTYGKKQYEKCLGLPFACYIEADGNIYACNTFVGDKNAIYGNIHESSFRQIWNSTIKKEAMARLSNLAQGKCRHACRMDSINNYLWDVKNPPSHFNFI